MLINRRTCAIPNGKEGLGGQKMKAKFGSGTMAAVSLRAGILHPLDMSGPLPPYPLNVQTYPEAGQKRNVGGLWVRHIRGHP